MQSLLTLVGYIVVGGTGVLLFRYYSQDSSEKKVAFSPTDFLISVLVGVVAYLAISNIVSGTYGLGQAVYDNIAMEVTKFFGRLFKSL